MKTRLNSSRTHEFREKKDIPATGTGNGGHLLEDAVEHLQSSAIVLAERREGDASRAAFVADDAAAKEHAQRRNPESEPQVEAPRPSLVAAVETAISALVPDDGNRVSVRVSSEGEEAVHAGMVSAAKSKELDAWESSGVFVQLKAGDLGESAVDIRRVLTWKNG